MGNNRLWWIILASNLTHMINFHDPSKHENGFLGDYDRLFSILKTRYNRLFCQNNQFFRPQKSMNLDCFSSEVF